ncbi:unnamed protein product [Ixodes pacificus]
MSIHTVECLATSHLIFANYTRTATRQPTRYPFPIVTIAVVTGSTTLRDLSYTISETVFVSCDSSPIATIKLWTNNSHSTRLSLLHSSYTMLSLDPLDIAHEIM